MSRIALLVGVITITLGLSYAAAADPGPAAIDYQLNGSDTGTLTLSGFSFLEALVPPNPIRLLTAQFGTDTRLLAAALDRYIPNDPYCPAAAANYNSALGVSTSDGGFLSVIIQGMAANGCSARVGVNFSTKSIISFQPVPGR